MSNDKQFIDFKKEVEKLKEIDGAEEYAKQLAHLFLGNGLSLQTILLMAIDFGQQHPHWIPVEERLPPKRKDPLVISDKVFIRTTGVHYLSAVYDYQDKQWIDVYNIETLESNEVTHWMKIVPPRKEDKMIILSLPLKKEWYNMIESGIKTEEYREIKQYWIKRLCNYADTLWQCADCDGLLMCSMCFAPRKYTHVRFRYGYTKRTMLREIESITIGYGKPEWGAPTDRQVFIIKFKKQD